MPTTLNPHKTAIDQTQSFTPDWSALFQTALAQKQSPPPVDLGALLKTAAQVQDPQGVRNKGYMPGVNNEYSPFANGFFQSANDRLASMQDHTGAYGPLYANNVNTNRDAVATLNPRTSVVAAPQLVAQAVPPGLGGSPLAGPTPAHAAALAQAQAGWSQAHPTIPWNQLVR